MKVNAKWFMLLFLAVGLVTVQGWRSGAMAQSSYFASAGCSGCHSGVTATCNGCHGHGVHATSAKTGINLTGTTNKTSYTPGETVSVTINGGYRTGWVRVILYNQSGNVELKRSTGTATGGMGGGAAFPITLTAPAPAVAGTYSWKVAWYGHQNDKAGATFGGANWVPDPGNPEHGREIVNTNSFTVAAATPADTQAPTISAFTLPTTSTSLSVSVSSLTATDNTAVTGYLVNTTSTAPAASAAGWSTLPPATVTAAAAGNVTFYAWAKDAAGNVSLSKSAAVAITISTPDAAAPSVTAFTLPATSATLTVPVTALVATDNVGVTGYLINTNSVAPAANAAGWSTLPPVTVTATAAGNVTFYAWAKDAAGNVSLSKSAAVAITISTPDAAAPSVTAFMLPATSATLTVPVTALVATDNVGVTGYLINTNSVAPAANATGWSTLPPSAATAATGGNITFYAWAKDAAGNVSLSTSATVAISLPSSDTVAPAISAFTLPSTSSSLSIPVSSFNATDNAGVTGYLVTTSSAAPAAGAAGWAMAKPTAVTAPAAGNITFYAWAKDAAGNVSLSKSASVTVTVAGGNTAPILAISTLTNGASTNNATLNVSGTVTAAAGLKSLTVNGQPVVPDEAGAFSYALTLKPGANKIKIKAVSSLGKVSVKNYVIKYDVNAPVLKVSSPADNSSTAKSFITVRGTMNERSTVSVKVNDGSQQAASILGNRFSATAYLVEGDNTIEITATDLAGNVSHAKRTITYDNTKPSIEVTDPDEDITIRTPLLVLKGKVSDALSDVKVKIHVNGRSFTTKIEDGKFEQQLKFTAAKQYPVTVIATDEVGNTTKVIRNIIYKPLTAKELAEEKNNRDQD